MNASGLQRALARSVTDAVGVTSFGSNSTVDFSDGAGAAVVQDRPAADGVGLVRGGAGTALVGDPETVSARIQEYADLGISTFIFSGYPHLEESIRFAELVFPLLPLETQQKLTQPNLTGPFGEIVANNYTPDENKQAEKIKESA